MVTFVGYIMKEYARGSRPVWVFPLNATAIPIPALLEARIPARGPCSCLRGRISAWKDRVPACQTRLSAWRVRIPAWRVRIPAWWVRIPACGSAFQPAGPYFSLRVRISACGTAGPQTKFENYLFFFSLFFFLMFVFDLARRFLFYRPKRPTR